MCRFAECMSVCLSAAVFFRSRVPTMESEAQLERSSKRVEGRDYVHKAVFSTGASLDATIGSACYVYYK